MASKIQPQETWQLWLTRAGFVTVIAVIIAFFTWIMGTHVLVDFLLSSALTILLVGLLFIFLTYSLLRQASPPDLEYMLGRLQGIMDKARTRTKAAGLIGVEQRQVLQDRIDRHFSSIRVEAYKRLRGLKIDKLSRINLFAGVNNSGKTTLLEAVYLLARQNDFDGLVEVIRRRGKTPQDRIDSEWLVEQIGNDMRVSGVFDGQPSKVSVRVYEETEADLDKSRYIKSVKIGTEFGAVKQESVTHVFKGQDRETQASSIRLLCPVVYSSPFFLNEPHRYASFYYQSTQSKSLPRIFEFMREAVLPTLKDIRLVDKQQRFLVDDEAFSSARDLTDYGEGLQRIFFISLLFALATNGVVLIDEFENAIHTELIGRFSGFIHRLAETFNVQVFLTSHSKECINAFVKGVKPEDAGDISFHALVPSADGRIAARAFTGRKFQRLLEAGDVDLRWAR